MNKTILNDAGGLVFSVSEDTLLRRFLILGTEGNTYYVSQPKLVTQNAKNIVSLIAKNGPGVVDTVVDVSTKGLAPKQDSLLFTLAICASSKDLATRQAAWSAVTAVCRTASMLFQFLAEVRTFRTLTGRMAIRAIQNWYNGKDVEALAYQMIKYRNRSGWTHTDVLRLGHVKPPTLAHAALYAWAVKGFDALDLAQKAYLPSIVSNMEAVKAFALSGNTEKALNLIQSARLPMEAIPTELLAKSEAWQVLAGNMPVMNTLRNLGNLSRHGITDDRAVELITDANILRRARIHPVNILTALTTYNTGRGVRGANTWPVSPKISAGLDIAFRNSFENAVPTGKRFLLGLDVSGSMSHIMVNGVPNLQAASAQTAMALVTMNIEKDVHVVAFQRDIVPLQLTKDMTLTDGIRHVRSKIGGSTDCSSPIAYALKNKIPVDVFVIYTDSQSWDGRNDVTGLLREYEIKMGIKPKLVVVAMAANNYTLAPANPDVLNVVGFDPTVPSVISAFVGVPTPIEED